MEIGRTAIQDPLWVCSIWKIEQICQLGRYLLFSKDGDGWAWHDTWILDGHNLVIWHS